MDGIFELKKPLDLFKKLEWEYSRLIKNPIDQYTAFNFFITAEHIPDWLFPKRKNRSEREKLKNKDTVLQICSHIANGAKHFQLEAKHHKSVSDFGQVGGYFPKNYFPRSYFPNGHFPKSQLLIQLDNKAQQELGATISILNLAERIMSFWHNYFKEHEK